MFPVLFTIGQYNVYAFGLFLAISFLFSTFIVWKYAREEFREEDYLDAYLALCVAALVSARFVYILLHRVEFGFNMLMYIVVRKTPGLSLFGGIVGGLLFFWSYAKKRKYSRAHLLDLFSVAACLGLVFAKIGQQLGGAGFGKTTTALLSVRITGLPGRYYPVELYESLAFLLLFFLLSWLYDQRRRYKLPKGVLACLFGVGALMIIFALEFLKAYQVYLYGLSSRQIAALAALICVLVPLVQRLYTAYLQKKES